MTKPQPIPEGYGTVTPWVVTKDTRRLLEFIKDAFDAEELARVEVEGGAIGHAEARIGDSIIMMFDSPFPVATPGFLRLYVEDGDAVFRRAVAAGATPVTRLTVLAWGDRVGRVRDPLGNIWWIQERDRGASPGRGGRALPRSEVHRGHAVRPVDPRPRPGRVLGPRIRLSCLRQRQHADGPAATLRLEEYVDPGSGVGSDGHKLNQRVRPVLMTTCLVGKPSQRATVGWCCWAPPNSSPHERTEITEAQGSHPTAASRWESRRRRRSGYRSRTERLTRCSPRSPRSR